MSLSHDEIEAILASGTTRKRKPKKIERTQSVWWKLEQHLTLTCENPECLDPRPTGRRNAVTANVDGKEMCRYCFLSGWGADEQDA